MDMRGVWGDGGNSPEVSLVTVYKCLYFFLPAEGTQTFSEQCRDRLCAGFEFLFSSVYPSHVEQTAMLISSGPVHSCNTTNSVP